MATTPTLMEQYMTVNGWKIYKKESVKINLKQDMRNGMIHHSMKGVIQMVRNTD
jgi:hypothetical protein